MILDQLQLALPSRLRRGSKPLLFLPTPVKLFSSPAPFVVKTYGLPLLILKGLAGFRPSNCESRARHPVRSSVLISKCFLFA